MPRNQTNHMDDWSTAVSPQSRHMDSSLHFTHQQIHYQTADPVWMPQASPPNSYMNGFGVAKQREEIINGGPRPPTAYNGVKTADSSRQELQLRTPAPTDSDRSDEVRNCFLFYFICLSHWQNTDASARVESFLNLAQLLTWTAALPDGFSRTATSSWKNRRSTSSVWQHASSRSGCARASQDRQHPLGQRRKSPCSQRVRPDDPPTGS